MRGFRRTGAPPASNGQAKSAAAEPAANGRGAGDGVARIKRTMKAGTDGNEWGWQDYRGGRKPSGKIGGLKIKGGIPEAWK